MVPFLLFYFQYSRDVICKHSITGAVIVMVVAPFSPAIWALTICWALAQLTLNSSYGAVTAMLPDQVREQYNILSYMGTWQSCSCPLLSFFYNEKYRISVLSSIDRANRSETGGGGTMSLKDQIFSLTQLPCSIFSLKEITFEEISRKRENKRSLTRLVLGQLKPTAARI